MTVSRPADVPRPGVPASDIARAPLARKRGLRFVAVVARDAPLVLRGDAMRIKQVLFNLLGNAIKFTGQGEVGLHAVAMDGGGLRFTVDDTGPGMDPVQQARLFRRFEQGDDGRAGAGYGGFGLGLAISRELVLAMGGCIRVDGAAGAGTRVVVELPLDVVDPSPADYRDVSSRKSMSPAM